MVVQKVDDDVLPRKKSVRQLLSSPLEHTEGDDEDPIVDLTADEDVHASKRAKGKDDVTTDDVTMDDCSMDNVSVDDAVRRMKLQAVADAPPKSIYRFVQCFSPFRSVAKHLPAR